jgi:hypothetical protein
MRLGDIKAKQAVFQAVDPVYGEPIEDVKIVFKPRSDSASYEKFSALIGSGSLDTAEGIAQAFFGILESGELGSYEFSAEGFQALLESPDSAFIGEQLVSFFTEKSNFFTIAKQGKKKK